MAESDEWATVETVEDDVFYENQRKPTSPVDTSTDYLNDRKISHFDIVLV